MKMLSTKKPLKALIADDSASIRTLLKHTLTKMGYEVTECTNGTEVWKLIKKGTYFIIGTFLLIMKYNQIILQSHLYLYN